LNQIQHLLPENIIDIIQSVVGSQAQFIMKNAYDEIHQRGIDNQVLFRYMLFTKYLLIFLTDHVYEDSLFFDYF